MANGRRLSDSPAVVAIVGVFCAAFTVSAVVSLFVEPFFSTSWFASLAGAALFAPVACFAASRIPAVARRLGGPLSPSDPRFAAMLLGCVALAFAFGCASGAIAWLAGGVQAFEVHASSGPDYTLAMPAFVALTALAAAGFASLTALALRRVRRTGGWRRASRDATDR